MTSRVETLRFNCDAVIQAEPQISLGAEDLQMIVDGLLMLLKYLQARNIQSVLAKTDLFSQITNVPFCFFV